MKKSKLFLSLISLCFSLAVLCFGVYAATSVNYYISGNITYEVSDVFVDISASVYKSGASVSDRVQLKTYAEQVKASNNPTSLTLGGKAVVQDNSYGQTLGYNSYTNVTPTGELDIEYNSTNALVYFVVINIENLGDNNVWAVVTSMDIDGMANSLLYASGGYSQIAKGDTNKKIVFAFALFDKTINIDDNVEINYKITLNSGEYQSPLVWDDVNSYYYIPLGKVGNTEIKWKLVSIDDGVTKYTAPNGTTSSSPKPTGVGVFILETYDETFNCSYFNDYTSIFGESNTRNDNLEGNPDDYSLSTIRKYLNGVNVQKTYTDTPTEGGYIYSPSGTSSNMLSELGILTTPVYKAIYDRIIERSLCDIYRNMKIETINSERLKSDYYTNVPTFDVTNLLSADKFWLFNVNEINLLLSNGLDILSVDENRDWNETDYWTTSYDDWYYGGFVFLIESEGFIDAGGGMPVHIDYAARSGFKLCI